jgi:hypothetical protein
MSKFNEDLMNKMISLGYPKKTLTASDMSADIYREIGLNLQKRGHNPAQAIEAAVIAKVERETGLPISAAIERQKMNIGTTAHSRQTVGNWNIKN